MGIDEMAADFGRILEDKFESDYAAAFPPPKKLHKLARTAMRSWVALQLKRQGGLCAICKNPIDLSIKGEGVVDHDHDTGEIRGVLHRSCNAAEGKIANAAGAWGAKSMKYPDIVAFLEKTLEYLKSEGTGFMYPMHKSAEEKKSATVMKLAKRRAEVKAKQALIKQQRSIANA